MSSHVNEKTEAPIVFDYLPSVNYALYQNHVPIIRYLSVSNTTDTLWNNLTVKIEPSDDFAEIIELHSEQLLPGSTFQPEIIVFFLGLKPPPSGGGLSSRIDLKDNCSFLY